VPLFFFTVEQQERAIVERFGKFVRVVGPGLHQKTPFSERVTDRLSLQVEQLNLEIETKTKDNVFVHVKIAIQYKVGDSDDQVKNACYKLDSPEVQMESYAFDVVRSHVPSLDLDEAYEDADSMAQHIKMRLSEQMDEYGYEIVKALVTNIEPGPKVKEAMDNINAARRNQQAAIAQGEADKILRVKKAEAEKESMRLQGEGVAEQRKAITEGLKVSVEQLADAAGVEPKEAMALVALTQYMDMLRDVSDASRTNTILLPHSPDAVSQLQAMLRDGLLTGQLTADGSRGAPVPARTNAGG
jgi:regulator of protease activity HflC (stomatin/prohibitin superfamily)